MICAKLSIHCGILENDHENDKTEPGDAVTHGQSLITFCSSGSSKIKGTASGIYPIPLQISGQYLYPSGSSSTSWGIYISPRKSRSLPGEYIYPPGSQLTSKSSVPPTYPSVRKEERLASQRVKLKLPLKRLRRFYSTKVS